MAMSRRGKLAFVLVVAAIVLGLMVAVQNTHRLEARPNIVLIVVDALRPDHLGVYGYDRNTSPNLDRLASRGVVFRNVYSSATMSKPALSSLLTSTHPSIHNALDEWSVLSDHAFTLAEALKDAGYQTALYNGGNPYLASIFNLDQGFDSNVRIAGGSRELTDEFLRALPELKGDKFFAYLHYMDVHTPYAVHSYNTLFKAEISPKLAVVWGARGLAISIDEVAQLGREDPDVRDSLTALYDGEIRSIDAQVKRVMDGLEKHGLLEDTLVIFTADHGEQLWDHDGFGHGNILYEEGIRVPLMLLGNGLSPADVESRVRLIDIFPTILESVGDDPGLYSLQGSSLWPSLRGDVVDRPVFSMLGSRRRDQFYYSLINEGMKLHDFWDGETVHRSLYNLESDPYERVDIAEARPDVVDSLLERLQRYVVVDAKQPEESVELDGNLQDRLNALGYLQR